MIKSQKSFTLIEILIVIGIIVVLAGIGFPVFRSYQPTLQLNGTARDLISNLRYAQQLALTEQIEYCVQFPADFPIDRKYQIVQCGESEPVKPEIIIPEEIIELTFSPALTNNEVRYNPYGAVKESTDITLKNTKEDTKTIKVRPSGFIKTSE